MLADVFDWQKQQIWPFRKRQGYDFPIVDLLGHVSVTKIRVQSFIDAENRVPSTEQISTETYRRVPLVSGPNVFIEHFMQSFVNSISFEYNLLRILIERV